MTFTEAELGETGYALAACYHLGLFPAEGAANAKAIYGKISEVTKVPIDLDDMSRTIAEEVRKMKQARS